MHVNMMRERERESERMGERERDVYGVRKYVSPHIYIRISFLILAPQLISTLFEVWPQIIKMTHHHPGSFHIMRIYIYICHIHTPIS